MSEPPSAGAAMLRACPTSSITSPILASRPERWLARRRLPTSSPLTPTRPWYARFNAAFAVKITKGVGTMWCAYAFAALALVSLPSAIKSGSAVTLVSWISQTFLQLVLLSIIIVGQNVLAAAADKRSEATYEDGDAVLHTSVEIQNHLEAQDAEIEKILAGVRQLRHA